MRSNSAWEEEGSFGTIKKPALSSVVAAHHARISRLQDGFDPQPDDALQPPSTKSLLLLSPYGSSRAQTATNVLQKGSTPLLRMASTTPHRVASTSAAQPYIVTLLLDDTSHTSLTALRKQHFPPHRNYLDAHVTFFHALPASQLGLYQDDLHSLASRTSAFPITVGPPFPMGSGVGISVLSAASSHPSTPSRPLIESLHARLLKRWSDHRVELTTQDKQGLRRPHVTVQNKVEKEEAEETLWKISKRWKDREGEAVGLGLWEYQKDGRWKHVQDYRFAASGMEGSSA